jgi:hypothetical protein
MDITSPLAGMTSRDIPAFPRCTVMDSKKNKKYQPFIFIKISGRKRRAERLTDVHVPRKKYRQTPQQGDAGLVTH